MHMQEDQPRSARPVIVGEQAALLSKKRDSTSSWFDDYWCASPRANARGELISAINVIDCGDEDDNYLEFCFGPPDPAVSPFRRTNHGGGAGARAGEVG